MNNYTLIIIIVIYLAVLFYIALLAERKKKKQMDQQSVRVYPVSCSVLFCLDLLREYWYCRKFGNWFSTHLSWTDYRGTALDSGTSKSDPNRKTQQNLLHCRFYFTTIREQQVFGCSGNYNLSVRNHSIYFITAQSCFWNIWFGS